MTLPSLRPDTVRCPEDDRGVSFHGVIVKSSRIWIPHTIHRRWRQLIAERRHITPKLLFDPRPILKDKETGAALRDKRGKVMRWGEVPNPPIDLAIVHPHHVSYPREMFPEIEAEEEVMEIDTKPRLHPVFYRSVIQPRDENQEEAFEALRVNRCGTSWQACGKGKTICSLNKIAESGTPAVVLVSNGGIAYQWKSRAMEFLCVRAGRPRAALRVLDERRHSVCIRDSAAGPVRAATQGGQIIND